jgi:hypothetical protein
MVGDNFSVVEAEHFKTDCGTSPNGNQTTEHFGLQQVMIRVVVPLAEKDEVSASQTFDQTLAIDESCGSDVPNTPGERMISAKR